MRCGQVSVLVVVASVLAVSGVALTGCSKSVGETPEERRAYAERMADDTLADLYEERPDLQDRVEEAPGYAVFSNVGTKILLLATGNGYGLVHNNETDETTYMRMQEIGLGIGLAIRDFYAVIIFHDAAVRDQFITSGWEWGAEAEASAKMGETGGAAEAAGSTGGMEIYQMTENGLALVASISGTKYWRDKRMYEEEEGGG